MLRSVLNLSIAFIAFLSYLAPARGDTGDKTQIGPFHVVRYPLDLGEQPKYEPRFFSSCEPDASERVGKPSIKRPEPPHFVSPDKRYLAVISRNHLVILSALNGKTIFTTGMGDNHCVYFSQASDKVLVYSAYSTRPGESAAELTLVSLPDGTIKTRIALDLESELGVVPSPDLATVALLTRERELELRAPANSYIKQFDPYINRVKLIDLSSKNIVTLNEPLHIDYNAPYGARAFEAGTGNFIGVRYEDKTFVNEEGKKDTYSVGRYLFISPRTGQVVREELRNGLPSPDYRFQFKFEKNALIARSSKDGSVLLNAKIPDNDFLGLEVPYTWYEVRLLQNKNALIFVYLTRDGDEIKTHFQGWALDSLKPLFELSREGSWSFRNVLRDNDQVTSQEQTTSQRRFFFTFLKDSDSEISFHKKDKALQFKTWDDYRSSKASVETFAIEVQTGRSRSFKENVHDYFEHYAKRPDKEAYDVPPELEEKVIQRVQGHILDMAAKTQRPEFAVQRIYWLIFGKYLIAEGKNRDNVIKYSIFDARSNSVLYETKGEYEPTFNWLFENSRDWATVSRSGSYSNDVTVIDLKNGKIGPDCLKSNRNNIVLDKKASSPGIARLLCRPEGTYDYWSLVLFELARGNSFALDDTLGRVTASAILEDGSIFLLGTDREKKAPWMARLTYGTDGDRL